MQTNVHEAKTHFSKLLKRVAAGEDVIIAQAGKPVARLICIRTPHRRRSFGTAKGAIKLKNNFDAPLPKHVREQFWR
ncbi:MAG TPA: type II toxin-antitoxin system Phd/YefM family antitoxin [Phycisphaerae bacterium]|nr:type II toxin-antitoxin system Phd/YefM family antitoxin [Phycisphaerae bacterium]